MSDEQTKPTPQHDHVLARVLPKGHDKIFTGLIDPVTNRPTKFPKGEVLTVQHAIARELEERGYIEIDAT